ncbi:MAG: primosomal protein N', partial [Proteobacteria bacterium]|nr:primosomal protein N' [Pseudomonadota bacterium]
DRDNLRAPPEGLSKKEAILDEANFRALNLSQQAAVDLIIEEGIKTTAKQPFLLFGITGSGKTEVFMNVLRDLLKRDPLSQAMILVPEISLTPQMTRIFCDRFPNLVAVVHSAMDDTERWQELARIRSGDARVLIGPRSAVFGPFQKLKLIIVDEEHDSSYKQGNGLLYNARDVAVMRGRIEGAAVVLGSATPSMESWLNAISSKYRLLQLPERASKRSLPEVNTIASKPSFRAMNVLHAKDLSEVKEESPFDPEIITALSQNLGRGHQSIVLVNRRGYAYYLYNLHEQKSAECPQCSISLSVHGKRRILKCHYCDFQTTVQKVIDSSPTSTWAVVGYGSQRAEDALKIALPDAKIARLDSDIVTDPRALPEILGKFRNGEIDILVGTQILAKGHDFPNVTLICILEVDQLLGLPDFRGGERTFQLLVQAAGRAGRGEHAGNVLVQSMRSNHPIVQEALKQDFLAFAEGELRFRKAMGYPPFGRMTLFEFNGTDRVKLDHWCVSLENILDQRLQKNPGLIPQVRVLGPAAAAIEVIRGRTRRTIIVLSGSHQVTRLVSSWILEETKRLPGDIRFKVDVDPQSTM